MLPWFTEKFGNPHSRNHAYGWEAEEAVEEAREQMAAIIGADAKEIIFTSGATESNNLAIKGVAHFYKDKQGPHRHRDHRAQVRARHLPRIWNRKASASPICRFSTNGLIDLGRAGGGASTDRTSIVSVMAVNNEIGVIQPIAEIGEICREKGVIFHVDAAQATGKMPSTSTR